MNLNADVDRLARLTLADDSGALSWAAATDPRYRRAYRIAATGDPLHIPPASDVIGVTYWAEHNQRWLPFAAHAALVRPAREVLEDDTLRPIGPARAAATGAVLLALSAAAAVVRALRPRQPWDTL